ncbi:hypothetical protein NEHOM01_1070 [Nematocida homosporus]|uniref:uncharacterized protein n=1 Tax=Nematocida homosporus TaxID=1912981 RepID=UPI00221E44E5|nr:uncharacterized protein NEHOM01_1070 [Nematocida homosporus]KAI5185793.1 hypothetical protein NEHOM01_1070 [Nematocida homosporus]
MKRVIINNLLDKNIATIQNMGDDLVPPLYLQRDPALIIEDEEPAPINPPKINRKKAEILEYQEPEEEREHKEERIPWLLEDSEQRAFVGHPMQTRITEDYPCTYYAMVQEKNEIKFYRIRKWYKFSPKIQYETLTLEEAEEKMQRRFKDTGPAEHTRNDTEEYKDDEFEYKEVFDDDDEGDISPEKGESARKKKLDSSGKDLKKLVKNYEKTQSDDSNGTSTEGPKTEISETPTSEITELDVKMHLYSGPMLIKTLIEKFKSRFKAHPGSKETLRLLIKRMCNIRTDPKTGEKLLVLKERVAESK